MTRSEHDENQLSEHFLRHETAPWGAWVEPDTRELKHAQKMICISHDKDLRIARIQAYKRACDECKEIFTEYWSKGDLTRLWPPGFFKPSVPIYSHPLPRHWRTTKRMT